MGRPVSGRQTAAAPSRACASQNGAHLPHEGPGAPGAFGLSRLRGGAMRICLMIEGQEDVTWEQWLGLAEACEAHDLEHTAYGFDMPSSKERVARLAEQLEIVNREWSDGPFDFHGTYFRLEDLDALPKPVQRPRPNLIVGGSAGPRSAALAARWADEYNTTLATLEQCRQRRQRVASAWDAAGRDPDTLRFSLMTTCVVGRDRAELRERLGRLLDRTGRGGTAEALIESAPEHWILGTVDQVAERLRGYEAAGVQRVMLQHLVHDDLDMVALIGDAVVPAVA